MEINKRTAAVSSMVISGRGQTRLQQQMLALLLLTVGCMWYLVWANSHEPRWALTIVAVAFGMLLGFRNRPNLERVLKQPHLDARSPRADGWRELIGADKGLAVALAIITCYAFFAKCLLPDIRKVLETIIVIGLALALAVFVTLFAWEGIRTTWKLCQTYRQRSSPLPQEEIQRLATTLAVVIGILGYPLVKSGKVGWSGSICLALTSWLAGYCTVALWVYLQHMRSVKRKTGTILLRRKPMWRRP